MDEKNDQTNAGGIHARVMKADNVVRGYQQIGGDLSQAAAALYQIAQKLFGG